MAALPAATMAALAVIRERLMAALAVIRERLLVATMAVRLVVTLCCAGHDCGSAVPKPLTADVDDTRLSSLERHVAALQQQLEYAARAQTTQGDAHEREIASLKEGARAAAARASQLGTCDPQLGLLSSGLAGTCSSGCADTCCSVCTTADEAIARFRTHGFVVFQLDVDATCRVQFDELREHMVVSASGMEDNRGTGRTCVNSKHNWKLDVWWNVLERLITDPVIKASMDLIGADYFLDCGGDVVDASAPPGVSPCRWHRDTAAPGEWYVASVLIHDVPIGNAPLCIHSWSALGTDAFIGRTGLVMLRDAWALHKGTANLDASPRAMPSFRFFSDKVGDADKPDKWCTRRSLAQARLR